MVVRIISPSPSWLTLLVTFLIGAATALAVQIVVQLYLVPKVETRKRREDRWERDVRELGELLTASLTRHAAEAHAAQLVFRDVRDDQTDQYDSAVVARQARDAEQATFAYGSLISTRVDWLIGQVVSINPKAQEIARLKRLARDYQERAIFARVLPDHDNRTDTAFHEGWAKESTAREALINQVTLLTRLRHPLRRKWRPKPRAQTRRSTR